LGLRRNIAPFESLTGCVSDKQSIFTTRALLFRLEAGLRRLSARSSSLAGEKAKRKHFDFCVHCVAKRFWKPGVEGISTQKAARLHHPLHSLWRLGKFPAIHLIHQWERLS